MAKHRLEDSILPNIVAYGISCHVPDYRLCWSLNKAMGLDLTRRRNDIVEESGGRALHYPVFEQRDDEVGILWRLVSNLCGKRRLLTDQKEADFFLLADAELFAHDEHIIDRLRGAEFVLTAFPLEMAALKMGHKLLL
ncbi:MAG TPA: IPExxxVDY family protein [Flavobacteriales bacterium]|nr:IPExxxVDY family protein [Flavobacteriales bacterium]